VRAEVQAIQGAAGVFSAAEQRSRLFTTAQQRPPRAKKAKHRSAAISSHETNMRRKVQISKREIPRATNNVKKTSVN